MVMEILFSLILLFLGIAVLVVIHVCIVGRAFRRGFDNFGSQEMVTTPRGSTTNVGTKTLSKEDLKNLPCFDYKLAAAAESGGAVATPVECVVCLDNFKVGESCRLLPNCNHSFHARCIDSWLLKTPICPICRTRVHPLKTEVILSQDTLVDVVVEPS